MKRAFILTLAAMAALMGSSCQKEELGRVLTATIEQYEHSSKDGNGGNMGGSKAYINDNYYACWETDDLVNINGGEYPILVSDNEHNYSATIQGTEVLTERPLLAFYPASMVRGLTNTGGTVTLPHVQTYKEHNGHQIIDNPMAAYCPTGSTKLKFRNLGALLKVTIQGNTQVKAIQVKGIDNQMLCGTARLKVNNLGYPMLGEYTQGANSVVLNFTYAERINGSKSFYIVMPDGAIFTNLTIAVLTTTGDTYSTHCKTNSIDQILLRNQIGAISYDLSNNDDTFLPDWTLPYNATATVTPYNASAFGGANFISSTFSNGNGLLYFDGPVTEIGASAFKNCSSLTTLTTPAGLTTIGDSAFKGCSSLGSIALPAGVTAIGNSAYKGCSSLGSIALPAGLTTIGDSAFKGCSSLRSITLPAGLTEIEDGAFYDCSKLGSIILPAGVTKINQNVFSGCISLSSVTLPADLTVIEDGAFDGCSSLSSIDLPADLSLIGNYAFDGCSGLINVNCYAQIPPSLSNEHVFDANIKSSAVLHIPSEGANEGLYQTRFSQYFDHIVGDLQAN